MKLVLPTIGAHGDTFYFPPRTSRVKVALARWAGAVVSRFVL